MDDIATRTVAAAGPGAIAAIGSILSYPPIIGVAACVLVRVPLFKTKSWLADVCLTGLAMLGTWVTISDHQIAPGSAFWLGIGFGAMGSTMIEIGKNVAAGNLKIAVQRAVRSFLGIKDEA